MSKLDFPVIYYGGDYNPDQWPEDVWQEDMSLFKKAGVNIVTLPVFSWAKLQPQEDSYSFEWFDKIMDTVYKNGLGVCLATSTAAQPAWMSKKYPEVLPVDFDGRKRKHGGRVNFCPNSKVFRELSGKLAGKLAQRYKKHPALKIWHIGNEYGNYCYCENCEKVFREWLKKRYGTIEELNKRWNLSFWGHTIYDWDEVVAPSGLSEMWKDGALERTNFQGMALDYKRFMSESSLECYKNEYEAIRRECMDISITTNLMGSPFKPLDYFKWAEHMDVVSWDNYPSLTALPSSIAYNHDIMRGLKNGQSFMLMEQTPSQQNWQPYNSLKRPGTMRLLSYQAMAHGADTVMFFQLRRSIGACEKFHGALIEHVGHEHTRVFSECAELGRELLGLSDIVGSRARSKVGIVFDWENWWAVELSSGPTIQLKYAEQVLKYYKALFDRNISVDIIKPDQDLSDYELVLAPVLYMIKPGTARNIEAFVERGGTFLTTFMSGIVDENDRVTLGGYPGELRKLLGLWVEEIDALEPGMTNRVRIEGSLGELKGTYSCTMLCDLLEVEGAEPLAFYEQDFYAGRPALTRNSFGKGKAYYLATDVEERFISDLLKALCDEKGIRPVLETPSGVEATIRYKGDKSYTFLINHNPQAVTIDIGENFKELISGNQVTARLELQPKGVAILKSMELRGKSHE